MVYITFDSNIWIYSLDDSWKIENQMDYLEYWIEQGFIKILLPQMVLDEWEKHEETQVQERIKKLKDFFEMAEDILPSAFFSEYKSPEIQRNIITSQLQRVKKMIDNCEVIPSYQEVFDRVIQDGIAKKAPMHKKSSIADAIIVYSLIHYTKLNKENEYYFVSENTEDFYVKENGKKSIHPDLKEDFGSNNIQAIITLNQLTSRLRQTYPINPKITDLRKNRIRSRLQDKAYNPQYEKLVASGESSFIQNSKMVDLILQESKPTKEQVIFVLALVDSDSDFEREFYNKLDNPNWFAILHTKGAFHPSQNPKPIPVENGYIMPFWGALKYLERLATRIKNNECNEYIPSLLSTIENICKKPIDNYRTWDAIIGILNCIPNNDIPATILGYVNVWLKSNFDIRLVGSDICAKLLPKFLYIEASPKDIEKAEIILNEIFSITDIRENNKDSFNTPMRGNARRDYDFIYTYIVKTKITERIARLCSDSLIYSLADRLKQLLLDFPNGIFLSIQNETSDFSLNLSFVNLKDIKIRIVTKDNSETPLEEILNNYENYSVEECVEKLLSILEKNKLTIENNKHNELEIDILKAALKNGNYYPHKTDSLSQLEEHIHYNSTLFRVLLLLFRNTLNDGLREYPEKVLPILKKIAFSNSYRLSIFKRIIIYTVKNNWNAGKSLFFNLVGSNDPYLLFSDSAYDYDLYECLNECQNLLTLEEIKVISTIINLGPRGDKSNQEFDYWAKRWYAALRNITPFKEKFLILSKDEKTDIDNYSSSAIKWQRIGVQSPLSLEKLNTMTIPEIVLFISGFKTKDHWEEPSLGGFSEVFRNSVIQNPVKYVEEIEQFDGIFYFYAYHLAWGLKEAWLKGSVFNWKNVLSYFLRYFTSEIINHEDLELKGDNWNANKDWVISALSELLTEGLRHDDKPFDNDLLPKVKELIALFIPQLSNTVSVNGNNPDYPTYSLNSTSGKVIRMALDYSLRRARHLKTKETNLFEEDVRQLFDESIKNGIIDTYIFIGWYFQQFCYLDLQWTLNKIEQFVNIEHGLWLGFIGGLDYGNAPSTPQLYSIFYAHYKKIIEENIQLKEKYYGGGIIQHILAFYLWDYEDFEDTNSLIYLLLHSENELYLKQLIFAINAQSDYLKDLDSKELESIEIKILNIWQFLLSIIHSSENCKSMLHFIGYIQKLNKANTDLIKSTLDNCKDVYTDLIIDSLQRLQFLGNLRENAVLIGEILNTIHFEFYILDEDKLKINDLVSFIYENSANNLANSFCDKMAREGHQFLIPVYDKYNSGH